MRAVSAATKERRIRTLFNRAFRMYETFEEPKGLGSELFYLAGAIVNGQISVLRRDGSDAEKELIRWFTDPDCWPGESWIFRYVRIAKEAA